MSYVRSETTVRRDGIESEEKDAHETVPADSNVLDQYVPNLFDLIFPTHRARDTVKLYIPSEYLQSEAVDSSVLVGHGASFIVIKQGLQEGPAEVVQSTDMGG